MLTNLDVSVPSFIEQEQNVTVLENKDFCKSVEKSPPSPLHYKKVSTILLVN